jgi:hypothetical protein
MGLLRREPTVKDLAISIAGANIERFSESTKLFMYISSLFFSFSSHNVAKELKKRKKLFLYPIELVLSNIFTNFAARKIRSYMRPLTSKAQPAKGERCEEYFKAGPDL